MMIFLPQKKKKDNMDMIFNISFYIISIKIKTIQRLGKKENNQQRKLEKRKRKILDYSIYLV